MTTPEELFGSIAHLPGSAWLDGGATSGSIVTWDPVAVHTGPGWVAAGRAMSTGLGGDAPFSGGCLGYVGYGAGAEVAPVPSEGPTWEPPIWLAQYAGGACWHPEHGWVFGGDPSFQRDARRLVDRCPSLPPPPLPLGTVAATDRSAHRAGVARILEWLAAGDVYQVNLTRAVHATGVGTDAFSGYRRLRRRSDAEYGAFLRLGPDLAVLSNSPEALLAVDGRQAWSEPIKGTRPRDPAADDALIAVLAESPKERAELAMIVDLVRNDLGRIAVPGSVRVERRSIRSHATVHHASQRVHATLREGVDPWDALAAVFPPGSVTGAPKISACRRIALLETEPRGVYCGAIGCVSGERARWSVAIRTAVWSGDSVRWHVGGGIVAGADADAEWDETVAKGRALEVAFARPDQP